MTPREIYLELERAKQELELSLAGSRDYRGDRMWQQRCIGRRKAMRARIELLRAEFDAAAKAQK